MGRSPSELAAICTFFRLISFGSALANIPIEKHVITP